MSNIVVLGGSVAGLLCGMQLARKGHTVTVLERESRAAVARPAMAPASQRAGAPHAVHGHALLARATVELRRALPEVYAALVAAGAGELDLVAAMPATIADRTSRPGDDDLVMLQARRHTFDRVLVELALATPRLDLRFDTAVTGLLLAEEGRTTPRVTSIRTADGATLAADLIIDASGRRTPVPGWLVAHGIELPLEVWDCGLVYYTRHFRVRPGITRPPLNRIFAAGGQLGSLRISWFPADNDTAMLVQTVLAEDQLLKAVRRVASFTAVTNAVPAVAAWCACADPISDIFAMGALQNTLRGIARDGRPLVLGLHLVGDAACTTNPVLGRGISFAAMSAASVVQAIAAEPDDLVAQALCFANAVTREIEPRFRENALNDRALVQRMRADLAGQPPLVPPSPAADRLSPEELLQGGMRDASLYRLAMRYGQLLAGEEVLTDQAVIEHARRIIPRETSAPPFAGPTRADLVRILAPA